MYVCIYVPLSRVIIREYGCRICNEVLDEFCSFQIKDVGQVRSAVVMHVILVSVAVEIKRG